MIICLWRLLNYVARSGLGVKGTLVLLRTPDGRVVVGKGEQIRYSGSFLVIDDAIMPLGNWRSRQGSEKKGLWDRQQLQELLTPALKDAQKLSPLEAWLLPWQLRFWPLLSFSVLTLVLLLLMIGLAIAKYSGVIGH